MSNNVVPLRQPFTTQEDKWLAQYLAKYNPDGFNRSGNALYERLVANEKNVWSWASKHPAQSWRNRYIKNDKRFNMMIDGYIHKFHGEDAKPERQPDLRNPTTSRASPAAQPLYRQPFTGNERELLAQYLAKEHPDERGRLGNAIYQQLTENLSKWPWARSHPSLSWREHYKKHKHVLDQRIEQILTEARKATPTRGGIGKRKQSTVEGEREQRGRKRRCVEREKSPDVSVTEEEVDELANEPYDQPGPSEIHLRKEEEEEVAEEKKEKEKEKEEEGNQGHERRGTESAPRSVAYEGEISERNSDSDSEQVVATLMREDADGVAGEAANEMKPTPTRSPDYELGYCDPSTTVPQDSQASRAVMSQVIPSPETLRRISLAEISSQPTQKVSQEPTPPTSDAHHSSPARNRSHTPVSKPQPPVLPRRKRRDIEVDYFASSPSRVSESRDTSPVRRPREPPILVDGSFTHGFTDGRGRPNFEKGARRVSGVARSESDTGSESEHAKRWPPVRGRYKGKDKAVEPSQQPGGPVESRIAAGIGAHHPFSQLTESSQGSPEPPRVVPRVVQAVNPHSISLSRKHRLDNALAKLRAFGKTSHSVVPAAEVAPPPSADPPPAVYVAVLSNAVKFAHGLVDELQPAVQPLPPHPASAETPAQTTSPAQVHPPILHDQEPDVQGVEDVLPSLTPIPAVHKNKEEAMNPPPVPSDRRHTIGFPVSHSPPLHARPDTSRSSSSSIVQYTFGGRDISPNDQEIATRLGMLHSIEQIAQNHGFQYEIALGVWQEVGSLRETDEVLRDMREAAQKQVEKRLMQRRSGGSGSGPLLVGSATTPEYNPLDGQHRSKRRSSTLNYTPVDTREPEYQPPSDSRAALFARLVGEGRIEEAMRRDQRRRKSGIMPVATHRKSA